jgi:hypothetical protein
LEVNPEFKYILYSCCRVKAPKKKDRLSKLMNEASAMMHVAAKAAKTHRKYLKAIAAEKSITISSSSESD